MRSIQLSAVCVIAPEHRGRFREIAGELIATVREHGPGALQYLWFYDADGGIRHVREIYRDLDALEAHAKLVGPRLVELLKLAKITFQFYGPSSPRLQAVVEFVGGELYEFADGVDRLVPA